MHSSYSLTHCVLVSIHGYNIRPNVYSITLDSFILLPDHTDCHLKYKKTKSVPVTHNVLLTVPKINM